MKNRAQNARGKLSRIADLMLEETFEHEPSESKDPWPSDSTISNLKRRIFATSEQAPKIEEDSEKS
jgi:hypothetical protein